MRISIKQSTIKPHDWFLILGLVLAPMTGWRIMHIGPGEVLTFIWCVRYIVRPKKQNSIVTRFFMTFILTMLAGTIWCMLIAPAEIALSHWASWLFLSISASAIYDGLIENDVEYNEHLFKTILNVSIIWYAVLYVYGITVSRTFIGAPLWYYHRYTGGAANPHQFAILMCGIVFCFVRYVLKREKVIINSIFTVLSYYLLMQSHSSTGYAAVILAALVCIALFVASSGIVKGAKTAIISLEVIFVIMFGVVFFNRIYIVIYEWIASDSNGLERFYLFSNIKSTFLKSPIVGLGPGNHSLTIANEVKEYHNMYLEIIAASGLIGTIAFIRFTIKLIKTVWIDYTFIPIIVAVYAYGVGGFALRRLPFWEIVVFSLVIAKQMEEKQQRNTGNMLYEISN